MCATFPGPMPLRLPDFFTRWIVGLFMALALVMAGLAAHAVQPAAGTNIQNQALANYVDASGTPRSVSSNIVQTIVQKVASLTLVTNNQTRNANPGSDVFYPHMLTNTGNATDSFNLTTGNIGGFSMQTVEIVADNGGSPGAVLASPVSLASGATLKFFVKGKLPGTATVGQTNTITVTATSTSSGAPAASNSDQTTVTNNAVIELSKSASLSSGPVTTNFTYTLTYRNTGNGPATNVAITDILPPGLTYTAGSARWSATGGTALSDTNGQTAGPASTVTSQYTAASRTFVATINNVTAGETGTISFGVQVTGTLAGTLDNTATFSYNDSVFTRNGTSNTVTFTVPQVASVSMLGATVPSAAAGTSVDFLNIVTNNGNKADTFNITYDLLGGSFPPNTSFQLLNAGGVPLVDSSGDNIPDTGSIEPGASYTVVLRASLPANATGTAPFSITKTATSKFDSTKSVTVTDTLTALSSASVDLTNDTATGTGLGVALPNGEAAAQSTQTMVLASGALSTNFTLVVSNKGATPDNYDLSASTDNTFSTLALPAGWSVSFSAGACPASGAAITNTDTVAVGGNAVVCAKVSVPSGTAVPGTVQLYFRARSGGSSAYDVLHNAVTVDTVRSITITTAAAGTVPVGGGSHVYRHIVTNEGNVSEGGAFSTVALTASDSLSPAWTTSLFYDTNGNATLDAGDLPVPANLSTLARGASITIFARVTAPTTAVLNTQNATTITVTTSNGSGSHTTTAPAVVFAIDTTMVIAGNVSLNKLHALDASCDGLPDTAYGTGDVNAGPNQCVLYQVTVKNEGTTPASSVEVIDKTPTYTTLSKAVATTLGNVSLTPALNAGGDIKATIGVLAAGQSADVTFGIKIDSN
jgi:uncharacterized repeat protein (TIGR01451 family)